MVYDADYDPSSYEPDQASTKGHGEAWERLNNHLFEEWRRFNARLEEVVFQLEQAGKSMSQARRSEHVSAFRQRLLKTYGTSGVDPRWEGERAKRLDARNQQGTQYRKGNHAA